jgi:DNA replication protein DnaC
MAAGVAAKLMWANLAAQADKEGWPAARFLAVLAEHEVADRGRRRIERHLADARLPVGKTLDTFDFNAVPPSARRRLWRLLPETTGWRRAPTACCWAHPEAARVT